MYKTGKCLTVEDRSPIIEAVNRGDLLPEEADAIFAAICRKGKMMNGPDAEEFFSTFVRIESFLGASNAATIMGHDQFKSPLMLQYELLEMVNANITPSQQHNFDYGHDAEPFVSGMCARHMRRDGMNVRFVDCPHGYINTMCPVVLVHPDGFIEDRDTGKRVLAEIKTAADTGPYWINYFAADEIPPAYNDQCQVEMEILDIDECWLLVYNKTGKKDAFKYLRIKRDKAYARHILEEMMRFWKDTFIYGVFWEDADILPGEENLLCSETDESLGYIALPGKSEKTLKDIEALEEERTRLKEDIREVEADIREIEKQLKLQKSRLVMDVRKAPGGTLVSGNTAYRIEKKVTFSKDQEAVEMLAAEDPDAYAALMKGYEGLEKLKKKVSIRITKKTVDDGEFIATVSEIE